MTELIYVEGPDHAGKTTLINKMRGKKDFVFHNGVYPSPEYAMKTYNNQISYYFDSMVTTFDNWRMFMDRGPIAERVYGEVMRNTLVDMTLLHECLFRLQEAGAQCIMCLPPRNIAIEGWKSRLDSEYIQDSDRYLQVYDMYAAILERPIILEWEHYDYTKEESYINGQS